MIAVGKPAHVVLRHKDGTETRVLITVKSIDYLGRRVWTGTFWVPMEYCTTEYT